MSSEKAEHTGEGHRILIVDDTPAIHEDIRKVLGTSSVETTGLDAFEADLFGEDDVQASGGLRVEVDSAYQGEEALELVRAAEASGRPYAMMFMDMRMPPGWDGVETIQRIWEVDANIEAVICTAYSDRSWTEILDNLGPTDKLLVLKKPFEAIEVQQIVHALLNKWSMQREIEERLSDLSEAVEERTKDLLATNKTLEQEIATREELEVELRQAQKLEAIGQLAAGIAHELNTPTQFIGDNVRFLDEAFQSLFSLIGEYRREFSEGEDLAVVRERLQGVEAAADLEYLLADIPDALRQSIDGVEGIAAIVKAMKEFGQPGVSERSLVDINEKIESTLIVARSQYKKVAEIVSKLGPVPSFECHGGELAQVLLNLLMNATQAIRDKLKDSGELGTITISSGTDGDYAVVEISDTGVGISEDIQDRVFDPFFTTREVGEGVGHGLAIARTTVVDKHGGSLTFETSPEGTTFFVRLPLVGAAATPEPTPAGV